MNKQLGRKIRLDKVIVDIDNAKRKIKSIEEELCYKQKEIQDINELIASLENTKSVLVRQLGKDKPKKVVEEKKVIKKTRKRSYTKKIVASLLVLMLMGAPAFAEINPKVKIAYDASNNPIYIGKAMTNTSTAAAYWQIKRLTYDASNNVTDIQWADGDSKYDNIWDNRAALTYK